MEELQDYEKKNLEISTPDMVLAKKIRKASAVILISEHEKECESFLDFSDKDLVKLIKLTAGGIKDISEGIAQEEKVEVDFDLEDCLSIHIVGAMSVIAGVMRKAGKNKLNITQGDLRVAINYEREQ